MNEPDSRNLRPETLPGGNNAAPIKARSAPLPASVGIGCAFLFLLVLCGGLALVRGLKSQIAHPSKSSLLGTAITAGSAGRDGATIAQALRAYHRQHGHYPQSLMELVAGGSLDGKLLHNALDDTPSLGHVSWRYTAPAEGTPGNTPVLEEPYHVDFGSGSRAEKIVVALDGRNARDSASSP